MEQVYFSGMQHSRNWLSLVRFEAQPPLRETSLLLHHSSRLPRSSHAVCNSVEHGQVVEVVVSVGGQVGRALLHLHLLPPLLPLHGHSHRPTEKGANRLHLGLQGLRAGKGAGVGEVLGRKGRRGGVCKEKLLLSWHRECWLQVVQSPAQAGGWAAHIGGVLAVAHAVAVAVLALPAVGLPAPGEGKETSWTQSGHGGARLDNLNQWRQPKCLVNIVLGASP